MLNEWRTTYVSSKQTGRNSPEHLSRHVAALKLLAKSKVTENGCWEYQGCKSEGYGVIGYRGEHHGAHVLSFKIFCGELHDGMSVLHHCDNRPCINPLHLYAGTHTDNMRDIVKRGRHSNGKKTVCKNGHPLEGSNLYMRKGTKGHRQCRRCNADAAAKYKARISA